MTDFLTHGRIVGGVVTTPDLDLALLDYRDRLMMRLVDDGPLDAGLAASWGCPASAGARVATLQPASGAHCFVRLVEQPDHPAFLPTRSYGWAAYEVTVQDVYGWPQRLAGSGFDIVGPPKAIAGLPYFVPMQVLGRGREMLYLNEVHDNTPSSDLPRATSLTDHIFIVILASDNLDRAVDWYRNRLMLDVGGEYEINYTMINNAFGLADGTQHRLTMVQAGRLPIVEVDAYPASATPRPRLTGMLPPGNALVTLAVDRLDGLDMAWISPPVERDGPLYGGRRTASVIGPAGEILELMEIGG